jgi:hypothetical protein
MFSCRANFIKRLEMLDKIRRWLAAHPNWTLALVVVAALTPFLAKPFNIDDPLFIWTAKQIQSHPMDPYGFKVNWYGWMMPMWQVTQNPPLVCYYLVLASKIFGWSEIGLHFAFLFPAVAVILGTHRLAHLFCGRPLLAALAALFAPVFLVSSTTLMCDVPMLALWVWAVVFWIEGTGKNDWRKFFRAALFITLAAMTKYFGICLIPLLATYSFLANRKFRSELFFLLIPLVVLCVYEFVTRTLYGHALFFEATAYAKSAQDFFGLSGITEVLHALTFTGGCMAAGIFFAPLLWKRRTVGMFAVVAILMAVIFIGGIFSKNYPWLEGARRANVELQITFWMSGGISVLALAVVDFWERRDARSGLLFFWVLGVFLFAALFNWTVNARSLLPMTPAIGILVARRLEKVLPGRKISFGAPICLAASAALALFLARADFLNAIAAKKGAQQIATKYGSQDGTLWFQGHWGFQFYMDELGASELDLKHSALKPGDRVAVPLNNTSLFPLETETTTVLETNTVAGPAGLTTWNGEVGAGFYASAFGPLPFVFGRVPPEKTIVYLLKPQSESANVPK